MLPSTLMAFGARAEIVLLQSEIHGVCAPHGIGDVVGYTNPQIAFCDWIGVAESPELIRHVVEGPLIVSSSRRDGGIAGVGELRYCERRNDYDDRCDDEQLNQTKARCPEQALNSSRHTPTMNGHEKRCQTQGQCVFG